MKELTNEQLDKILMKKQRQVIAGLEGSNVLDYVKEKRMRGLTDGELSLEYLKDKISQEEFEEEINSESRSKKRHSETCKKYGLTEEYVDDLQLKTDGLQEHFGLTELNAWQVALLFSNWKSSEYIEAVIKEIKKELGNTTK